jgi:hypothetical protein
MSEAKTYHGKADHCTELAEKASTAENKDALHHASDAWLRLAHLLEKPPLRILWTSHLKSN